MKKYSKIDQNLSLGMKCSEAEIGKAIVLGLLLFPTFMGFAYLIAKILFS